MPITNSAQSLSDLFSADPDDPLSKIPAAIEAETGYRPHPTTCTRWTRQGVGGVKLKTVTLGGKPRTTRRAVRLFISQRSEQSELQDADQHRISRRDAVTGDA